MIPDEDRAWIKILVHEAVTEAMTAERKLVEAAIKAHEQGPDHDAFRYFIAAEERKQEQWDKIKASVIGGTTLLVLGWVGTHVIEIATWIAKTFGK